MIASSTVRPTLEWISTLDGGSTSPMRLVKPITRTRGSPAKRSLTRSRSLFVASAQAEDLGVVGDAQRHLDGADDVTHAPAAAGDGDHGAVLRQPERGPG